MSDADRLDRLENLVRALYREVESLRADVTALRGAPAAPRFADGVDSLGRDEPLLGDVIAPTAETPVATAPIKPSPRPWRGPRMPGRRAVDQRPPFDLESLVGRYGTIALATLTILMGTGVFLKWAVEHVQLGPALRVALGAVWASVIAGVAVRLRARGERGYSNVLLALSLAIVHVDAWAAGPRLHVVHPITALTTAAIASIALAAFALQEGEQTLFAVGVGGALLAPFVTSERGGDVRLLMLFCWIVITGGLIAVRARPWHFSRRLLAIGATAYIAAGVAMLHPGDDVSKRIAPAALGIVCAWTALACVAAPYRRAYALSFLGAALIGTLYLVDKSMIGYVVAMTGTITLTSYLALRLSPEGATRGMRVGAIVVPLVSLVVSMATIADVVPVKRWYLALGWMAAALAMAYATHDREEREAHLFAAAMASLGIPILALDQHPVACIAAYAADAAIISWLLRRERSALLAFPALIALGIATSWTDGLLLERAAFRYTPFVSEASMVALACVAAWWVFGRSLSRATPMTDSGRALLDSLGAVAAFFWVREELSRAYSPDLANFLLIAYYAFTGVVVIFLGRRRGMRGARRVGLALAVFAALKALAQTSDTDSVALRVVSYLLVGCFLLGVAYWYRATSTTGPLPVELVSPASADVPT
ncbi:MAG: DUF2339 domain-containing protein [Gemmatimonadota bacterium]|nr:DUF2339 domain-containing protein [Gemmatimonadota bacterium]